MAPIACCFSYRSFPIINTSLHQLLDALWLLRYAQSTCKGISAMQMSLVYLHLKFIHIITFSMSCTIHLLLISLSLNSALLLPTFISYYRLVCPVSLSNSTTVLLSQQTSVGFLHNTLVLVVSMHHLPLLVSIIAFCGDIHTNPIHPLFLLSPSAPTILALFSLMITCTLTLRTSEAGIPALRKLPCGVGRRYTGFAQTSLWRRKRYTGGTVCQRQASNADKPAFFSNAYWHLNARGIEIRTRQQLKNNFSYETQRIFVNKFCIWTPGGQRTS